MSRLFNYNNLYRALLIVPTGLLVGASVVQYRSAEEKIDQLKKINHLIAIEEQHQQHHLTVIEDAKTRQNDIEKIAKLLGYMREVLPNNMDIEQAQLPNQQFGTSLPVTEKHWILMKNGLPSSSNLWFYDQFIVSHDLERKIPSWVIQRIDGFSTYNPSDADKLSDRKSSYFTGNHPFVDGLMRADNKDYLGSGWSRGHLVPASDMARYPQQSMNQTFLLNSNIVPQNMQNNGNFWYRLECYCKSTLPKQFDGVTVVSGPLFKPNLIEQIEIDPNAKPSRFPKKTQRKYIKHEVIGENNVAVPTHLFKVIMVERKDMPEVMVGAFVIPNEPIGPDAVLTDYEVPVETLERETGLKFFTRLQQKTLNLCEYTDCKMMTERDLDIWNIPRRIGWSKNKRELDRVIEDAKSKNIDIETTNIIKAYNDKIKELDQQQQQQQTISSPTSTPSTQS
ncbi:hypothetical protein PPL_06022 [Heterostelium album PN500]|uniref:Uncharacterized protein n=1 Tax=Heterostelium pallidum (strain ATCC 26659 / Pp 5 / PN500) TaxID=670386 RepID=D3BC02_HETP5|nr:hypothetical protein PPL_06022 [Heterostelium album PN500]EFA81185.1 hypothetical protein PPL_06022 [Heterostelium album PN500]|eukprot:XP_020433303.1 hypothetical protein PPL_06022 [Heterostelium album PN500]